MDVMGLYVARSWWIALLHRYKISIDRHHDHSRGTIMLIS